MGRTSPAIDRTVLDRIRAIEAQGSTGLLNTIITYYVNESPATFASLREAFERTTRRRCRNSPTASSRPAQTWAPRRWQSLCKEMELAGRAKTTRQVPSCFSKWKENSTLHHTR